MKWFFKKNFARNYETSTAWSKSRSSQRPSQPVYYIDDCQSLGTFNSFLACIWAEIECSVNHALSIEPIHQDSISVCKNQFSKAKKMTLEQYCLDLYIVLVVLFTSNYCILPLKMHIKTRTAFPPKNGIDHFPTFDR